MDYQIEGKCAFVSAYSLMTAASAELLLEKNKISTN